MNFARRYLAIFNTKNMIFEKNFESSIGVGQIEIMMSILCKGDILGKQKNVVGENYKVKVITFLSGQQNTIGEIQKMLVG